MGTQKLTVEYKHEKISPNDLPDGRYFLSRQEDGLLAVSAMNREEVIARVEKDKRDDYVIRDASFPFAKILYPGVK